MTTEYKDADKYQLGRFVSAQADRYDRARNELAGGRKQTHWMWFIFPQYAGLGSSLMAQEYAISGLAEAVAYAAHPVLGSRLRECVALVNRAHPEPLDRVLGYPDDLKFRSCVTLFDRAWPGEVFEEALRIWFAGKGDSATLDKLQDEECP